MRNSKRVVILNPVSSRVRDRTTAGGRDAVEESDCSAGSLCELFGRIDGGGRRTVPRAGYAAAEDDIGKQPQQTSANCKSFLIVRSLFVPSKEIPEQIQRAGGLHD